MTNWSRFDAETARWRESGRALRLWWRDDDSADVGPEFDRLLDVRRGAGVPLALAVVPAKATPALVAKIGRAHV